MPYDTLTVIVSVIQSAHISHISQSAHSSHINQSTHISHISQSAHISHIDQSAHTSHINQSAHISHIDQSAHISHIDQSAHSSHGSHPFVGMTDVRGWFLVRVTSHTWSTWGPTRVCRCSSTCHRHRWRLACGTVWCQLVAAGPPSETTTDQVSRNWTRSSS